jgi:PAS domain S-box-containing protein
VNEQAQLEKTECERPELSASILGSMMYAIIAVDDTQRIVVFNAAAERMFACPASEAIGSSVERFIPDRFRAGHSTRVRRFAESGVTSRTLGGLGTLWGVRATGEEFPIEASISKVESGGQKYFTVVIRDITERKVAEESRNRLAAIVESSEDAIISKNLDAVIVTWNPAAQRIFGYMAEDVIGQPITILIPPELSHEENKILEKLRAGERINHFETIRVTKTGKKLNVSLTISPIRDSTGEIVGFSKIVRDITERKRAEEALRASEERLRLAESAAHVGTFDLNLRTGLDIWQPETEALFGLPPGGFGGTLTAFEDLIHPDDRERIRGLTQEMIRTKQDPDEDTEYRVVWPDGSVHWIAGRGRLVRDESGELSRIIGVNVDITSRKLAEQELAITAERLHLAIEAGSVGGWDFDLKNGRTVWFGKSHAQLGMTPSETVGSSEEFWERVHEDDRADLRSAMRLARVRHEEFNHEFRVVRWDGTTHWLRSRGRYQYAANGEPERLLGLSIDITESKEAEQALLRHSAIVESSDDGISSVTLDGITLTWNAGAQRMFGYTENEMVGKPASIIVPPELRDEQKKILETLWAGGRIEQFETVRVSKTGKRIDVSLSISPIKDSTGKIVGCAGIARDITQRKRAEEASLSSEQRYRLLFERNVAGVGIGSLDGRVLDCNDGWARILGYESRGELLGRHASEFYFNPHDRQRLVDELRDRQQVFSRELQLKRKDGSPVWVLFNAAALNTEHNAPLLQTTMIDISEWKRSELALADMTRKLIEAQEQERARIARELHDDINQRLALLAVELGQAEQNHPDLPTDILNCMREWGHQTSQISADVQALSHDLHSSQLEYLGFVAGMKGWCKEFGERQRMVVECKHDVRSSLHPEIGLCLFRVLQEALHNAAKHSGVKRIEVQLREEPGEIHLTVSDSGSGFDVEAVKQRRGLGLTSMRERVRLVNGTIAIDSKPMVGTTIHVRVPLESEQVTQRAAV